LANSHDLKGRKALVTGGAKRLGREICMKLGRAGVHLAIHYNSSSDAAAALCRELEAEGVNAVHVGGNLEDPAVVEAVFQEAWQEMGGLDLLVNNASIFPAGRLEEMSFSDLLPNLKVNAWAPFILARALWGEVRDTDSRASVVNLLDTRLVGKDLAHAPYHLSKAVLAELTTMMALDFAPQVQVNGVAPGAVLPPEEMDEDYLAELTEGLPLKRRGYPSDIADAVLYLLSASFVTGQVIFVDGGRHIRLGGST
jgi:NAD(P)-dependent dehydrogenase (short-subunit alcohol dehydrogenase family)